MNRSVTTVQEARARALKKARLSSGWLKMVS